ncbi:MAG: glycosyltransferase family 25 protein [Pseudomonadota bacterium]
MTAPTLNNIPIWLINLPGSTQRFSAMDQQLRSLGLTYTLFEAVNGKQDWSVLKDSVDIADFERNVGRPVMPGEIGCYHSHLRVWEDFAKTDAPVSLILEDDVVFADEFRDAVDAALLVHEQWDILKLNHIRAKLPINRRQVGKWSLCEFIGPLTGTGAYLINQSVIPKLQARFQPITRPIDHEMDRSHIHKIQHFGLCPFPSVVQDDGQSTITGRNHSGVQKFSRFQRLHVYVNRIQNLLGKAAYALRRDGRP